MKSEEIISVKPNRGYSHSNVYLNSINLYIVNNRYRFKCRPIFKINVLPIEVNDMLIISKHLVTNKLAVRTLLLVWVLSCSLLSCNSYNSEFVEIKPIATHFNGMEYIGMQSCVECHQDIVESHKKTSHYKTSFETAASAFDEILKTQPN